MRFLPENSCLRFTKLIMQHLVVERRTNYDIRPQQIILGYY